MCLYYIVYSNLGSYKKNIFFISSSIPPKYVYSSNSQRGDSNNGDVVILVPNLEGPVLTDEGIPRHHHVCIETEAVIEQNSPKTIMESSSTYIYIYICLVCWNFKINKQNKFCKINI